MMLPINGNGLARGNFTDTKVIAIIQGERYLSQKTLSRYRLLRRF